MKKIIPTIGFLLLANVANASSWTCTGKNVTAVLEETEWGLILGAESHHDPLLGSVVGEDNIRYSGGETLKHIREVRVESNNIIAVLDIKKKQFVFADSRRLIQEENLKCVFSK